MKATSLLNVLSARARSAAAAIYAQDQSKQPYRPKARVDLPRRQHYFGDDRSYERLVAHYLLERKLSDRLRHAPRDERAVVYTAVYNELFASLPDHPQNRRGPDNPSRITAQLQRVATYLRPDSLFLEIGCGDAALAFATGGRVRAAYGLDVTNALIDFATAPPNFTFLQTTSVDIPLPTATIDFAYSNQLMEHLHPDDAADQLGEVYRVLKPDGRYMCITPSRVTGPHDISAYFDYEATGLHLKEYDYGTLYSAFRRAGFREFSCFAAIRGCDVRLPYAAFRAAERGLMLLPAPLRARLTCFGPAQALLGLSVVATK
jgi:SAM-dependent methyltransferase